MKIKKMVLFFLAALSLSIFAQRKGIGAGVLIGAPTGISVKYWLNNNQALDAAAGYSIFSGKGFEVHLDYLYHIFNSEEFKKVTRKKLPIAFFYGYGLSLGAGSKYSSGFGFRGVLGAEWLFENYNVDVFLEAAPVFKLLPETAIDFQYAAGARYFFKVGF